MVKWLLAVPHYVALFFLGIGALIAVVVAWFAILLTGCVIREGYSPTSSAFLRWATRVEGYMLLLVTDRYPPFRLGP